MSLPNSTESIIIAYKAETAYASGNSSTAFACTPYTGSSAASGFLGFNYIRNEGDNTIAQLVVDRDVASYAGHTGNTKLAFSKGYKTDDFTLKQYMQMRSSAVDTTWLENAYAGTFNTIPTSYTFFVYINGIARFIYGVVVSEYTQTITAQEFVAEDCKFSWYATEVTTDADAIADFVADIDWNSGVPFVYGGMHISEGTTFPGTLIDTYTEFSFTITNTFPEHKHAGTYYRYYPYTTKRDVTANLKTYVDTFGLLKEKYANVATVPETHTLWIYLGGVGAATYKTLKLTPLFVMTDNEGNMPAEYGHIELSFDFEIHGTFAPTLNTNPTIAYTHPVSTDTYVKSTSQDIVITQSAPATFVAPYDTIDLYYVNSSGTETEIDTDVAFTATPTTVSWTTPATAGTYSIKAYVGGSTLLYLESDEFTITDS